jgi:hypothetical protein
MANVITTSLVEGVELFDLNNNSTWAKLYPVLKLFVQYLVYSSNIPSWKEQESETIECSQKTERGASYSIPAEYVIRSSS